MIQPVQSGPIGAWLSRTIAWPLWEIDNRTAALPALRSLERTQWLSRDQLAERQWAGLKRTVAAAYERVPYYRARFHAADVRPDDIRGPEDFRRLPILTKRDVQQHAAKLFDPAFPESELVQAKTGGSTGHALTVHADRACRDLRNAAAMRSDRWAGWDLGVKRAALWGNPSVPHTWRARLREACLDRTVVLDTMNMTDDSMREFVNVWRAYRPEVLFGHSHSLFIFAVWLRQQGILDLRPTGIISTSMMLLPSERAVIEEVFRCRVTDRYGCEEVGLIACECDRHDGLHINVDHVYVEFLRDDGTPAPAGEPAALVLTDLINRAQPLLRYRVEDVASWSTRQCGCGRGLPLMNAVTGRVADYLLRRDGSRVAGVSLVERTLTAFPGIEQMQIIQDSTEHLTLKIVRMATYRPETERQLAAEFLNVFGDHLTVAFDYVERIPQARSGKYRFAICNVPAPAPVHV
jgi:phenylacetate-CoA ligase